MRYKYLFFATLAALITVSAVFVTTTYADLPIRVFIDEEEVEFPDAQPQWVDGRIFVPIRFVAEALGAEVGRDPAKNYVLITSKDEQQEEPTIQEAQIGETVEFESGAKVKVTGVEYAEELNGIAISDMRMFIVYMDVLTPRIPDDRLYLTPLSFIYSFIIDGKEIRGSISTSEEYRLEANEMKQVHVYKTLHPSYEVNAVILNDPFNENSRVRINF